jgi:ribosomal protein L25 (general stress protein Ctc)
MALKSSEELKELIEKALKRSALKAREVALQTNTPIVIEVDGEVKEVFVTEQDVQQYREEIKDAL